MEKRNKLWRRCHQKRLFKKRLQRFTNEYNCHWFELAESKWCKVYKTTGTPCSCWMCRGEVYNRRAFKKTSATIIKESIED